MAAGTSEGSAGAAECTHCGSSIADSSTQVTRDGNAFCCNNCGTAMAKRGSHPAAERRSPLMAKLALLATGVFLGGAIDHAILALSSRSETPYGIRVGVRGNVLLGAIDLLAALLLARAAGSAGASTPREQLH